MMEVLHADIFVHSDFGFEGGIYNSGSQVHTDDLKRNLAACCLIPNIDKPTCVEDLTPAYQAVHSHDETLQKSFDALNEPEKDPDEYMDDHSTPHFASEVFTHLSRAIRSRIDIRRVIRAYHPFYHACKRRPCSDDDIFRLSHFTAGHYEQLFPPREPTTHAEDPLGHMPGGPIQDSDKEGQAPVSEDEPLMDDYMYEEDFIDAQIMGMQGEDALHVRDAGLRGDHGDGFLEL